MAESGDADGIAGASAAGAVQDLSDEARDER
jgi:hypothetical protein